MISKIYEGWKNSYFPKTSLKGIIEDTSKERLNICNSCEHHSKNNKSSIRPDAHCMKCGCTLLAKTKCLSCECPIEKWKAVVTKEQGDEMNNYGK